MGSTHLLSPSMRAVLAQVPLLKFVESQSGLHFDVCANSTNGVENSSFIRQRLVRYPAVRPLLIALKCVLQQHGLHDTFTGGIGSYLLFLMALRVVERIWVLGIEANFGAGPHDRVGDLGLQLRAVLRTYAGSEALEICDPLSEGNGAAGPKDIGCRAFRFDEIQRIWGSIDGKLEYTDCLSVVLRGWPQSTSLPNYDALVRLCKSTFCKPPVGRDLSNMGGGGGGGRRWKTQPGGKKRSGGMFKDHGRKGGGDDGRRNRKGQMTSAIQKGARNAKGGKGGGKGDGKGSRSGKARGSW